MYNPTRGWNLLANGYWKMILMDHHVSHLKIDVRDDGRFLIVMLK